MPQSDFVQLIEQRFADREVRLERGDTLAWIFVSSNRTSIFARQTYWNTRSCVVHLTPANRAELRYLEDEESVLVALID
jgi:hypothetical protein